MGKVNDEIKDVAEKMEKSEEKSKVTMSPETSKLVKAIFEMGPEKLAKAIPTLSEAEKIVLKDTLEGIKKAVSMDKDYAAKYHMGNVYKDTVIQEDVADDDADEKLVKPEAVKQNHQGDDSPEGRDKDVKIKDPDMSYDDDDKEKMVKEKTSSDSGIAGNPEEGQSDDNLEALHATSSMGDKARPEALKIEQESYAAQKDVDNLSRIKKSDKEDAQDPQESQKVSFEWDETSLLAIKKGGRGPHFSVNDFYDEALEIVKKAEKVTESKDTSVDSQISEIIEKGEDCSYQDAINKATFDMMQTGVSMNSGASFEDNDLRTLLKLSEKEAKEILGE